VAALRTIWVRSLRGSLLCVYAVQGLAGQLGIDRGRLGAQVSVFILVVVPAAIVWGHYEDVLAICFVLLALGALLRNRSLSAALLFGVAVALKEWALLGIPLLVAVSPVGERPTVAVRALVVPALLVAFPLAVDWAHASRALIWTRSYPQMGHRAVWVSSSVRVMVGNPSRLGAFLVVFAVTWWLRGRAEPRLLLAGFGIAFPGEAPLRAGAVLL